MTGQRLEPEQRREQLLDVGAAMFAEKPYEDVFVDDIAARAGVSRALMYRYFPSKRALYVAMFKRASSRLLERADLESQLPLAEQLAAGLEAHIRYFAAHPFEAIAINRGALSDDPAVQAIINEELNVIGERLIDKLVVEGRRRDVTEIAVRGWLAFVRAVCVEWVQSQKITEAELAEVCLRAFDCALESPDTPHARPKELTHKRRRRGALGGVAELTTAITAGAQHYNRNLGPLVSKAADNIIGKVQRGSGMLSEDKTHSDH
jgi:AcrR family transcriptional regulator